MSPEEYKDLSRQFLEELAKRIAPVRPLVIKRIHLGNIELLWIVLGNELFELQNDGNESFWDFLGYVNIVQQ